MFPGIVYYDYLAAFVSPNGAPVTVAIEVKPTEEKLQNSWTVPLSLRESNAVLNANTPVLIVAIDVKNNDLRFNWSSQLVPGGKRIRNGREYKLPLRNNTNSEREKLRREIRGLAPAPRAALAAHA